MGNLFTIFSVIKELIALIKVLMEMVRKIKLSKEIERRQELEKALEDLKNAKTDEEIWDAQKRISDNSN